MAYQTRKLLTLDDAWARMALSFWRENQITVLPGGSVLISERDNKYHITCTGVLECYSSWVVPQCTYRSVVVHWAIYSNEWAALIQHTLPCNTVYVNAPQMTRLEWLGSKCFMYSLLSLIMKTISETRYTLPMNGKEPFISPLRDHLQLLATDFFFFFYKFKANLQVHSES